MEHGGERSAVRWDASHVLDGSAFDWGEPGSLSVRDQLLMWTAVRGDDEVVLVPARLHTVRVRGTGTIVDVHEGHRRHTFIFTEPGGSVGGVVAARRAADEFADWLAGRIGVPPMDFDAQPGDARLRRQTRLVVITVVVLTVGAFVGAFVARLLLQP